jgi:hypothetical protein
MVDRVSRHPIGRAGFEVFAKKGASPVPSGQRSP